MGALVFLWPPRVSLVAVSEVPVGVRVVAGAALRAVPAPAATLTPAGTSLTVTSDTYGGHKKTRAPNTRAPKPNPAI